jgi:hypothetical protein
MCAGMIELTDDHRAVLADLAASNGNLQVTTDRVHQHVLELWTAQLIRASVVSVGKVKLELTEKGWAQVRAARW